MVVGFPGAGSTESMRMLYSMECRATTNCLDETTALEKSQPMIVNCQFDDTSRRILGLLGYRILTGRRVFHVNRDEISLPDTGRISNRKTPAKIQSIGAIHVRRQEPCVCVPKLSRVPAILMFPFANWPAIPYSEDRLQPRS